ncbi:MAG: hypothetical protein AAB466_05920 [Verrucomicrobiota bacterium]
MSEKESEKLHRHGKSKAKSNAGLAIIALAINDGLRALNWRTEIPPQPIRHQCDQNHKADHYAAQ